MKRRKTSSAKKRRNLKHRSSRVKSKTLKRRVVVKQRIPVEEDGSSTPRSPPPNHARNLLGEFNNVANDDRSTPSRVSATEIVWKNSRGEYHNIEGPAIIKFYPSGDIEEEQWLRNGVPSRPGGLPVTVTYGDGAESPVSSETFKFETEYEDEDGEITNTDYYYIRSYLGNTLLFVSQASDIYEEPEERFENYDGFEVEREEFENNVGEDWFNSIFFARDLPRDSFPTFDGRTVSWKNTSRLYNSRGAPAVLSFFESGRLRSEKWYINGVYQRDGNLPQYVSYRDNSSALNDRIEMEIWSFYNPDRPDVYAQVSRKYNNQGELEGTIYGTVSGIGEGQIMPQEEWERLYGTPTLVSTVPSQQSVAPRAPVQPQPEAALSLPMEDVSTPTLSNMSVVWRNYRSQLHNLDGPAILSFYRSSGVLGEEEWFRNDKPYGGERGELNPISISYLEDEFNTVESETYLYNDDVSVESEERGEPLRYRVTFIYIDVDGNELETPKMDVLDENGDNIDMDRFLNIYDIYWEENLISTRRRPRNSVPVLRDRVLTWINPSTRKLNRDGSPAMLEFHVSGKLYQEKWYADGVLRREGNLPQNVFYRDDDLSSVEIEIWSFPGLAGGLILYSQVAVKYNASGEVLEVLYAVVEDLAGTARVIPREEWVRLYGTPTLVSTVPSQQSVQPAACPREDISYVREPRGEEKEVSKCSTIFKVERDGDYPLGDILDNLYRECNFLEDPEIDHTYLTTTAKYLQKKFPFPLSTQVRISTVTGDELVDAVKVRDIFSSYIPQGETSSGKIRVTYTDAPGIDYGGLLRQFIDELMGMISTTMFDAMEIDDKPFMEILDTMTDDERRKAFNEASKPRFFISKKTDDEISQLTKVPVNDIPKAYKLAGSMFAYAVINQVPFRIPLSRILLKKMLNDNQNISDKERLAAYILDTGSNLSRDINLRFDYGGDDMDMVNDYLTDLESGLKESSREAYNVDNARLRNFIDGFKKVGDILRQRNFTINELNAMVTKSEITRGDMEKFVASKIIFENFGRQTQLINSVKELILNVGDYGQLLKWWTGTSAILNKEYRVKLVEGFDFNFNAHTCFFRFDVNKDIITAPNFLDEFKDAITNVKLTTL